MRVAPRFLIFAAACLAWFAAMVMFTESRVLQAAGAAWFANWSVQIAVSATSWRRPFSLPERYYRPLFSYESPHLARLFGVRLGGRIANWINPFRFDRRSPRELEAIIGAAETTHVITLSVITVITLVLVAWAATGLALFLALWNVLFNLYPIAIQRHTRRRLQQLIMRRASRSGRQPAFEQAGRRSPPEGGHYKPLKAG